jgi:hypothetical protein
MTETRYAIFAALYAFGVLLDHDQLAVELEPSWAGLAVVAGLWVLLSPWSTWAFALLLFAEAGFVVEQMPESPNLGVLHLVISATALTSLAALCARRGTLRVDGASWLAEFAPAVRLEMLVVYAWAFWQKVNWGYLDPDGTCAVGLYEQARGVFQNEFGLGRWTTLPGGRGLAWPLIVSSLAIEACLPFLLIARRTRHLGVAVGLVFHLFLGLGYFYAFSATAMSILLLFCDEDLDRRIERGGSSRRTYRIRAIAALLGLVGIRLALGWDWNPTYRLGQYLFVLFLPACLWAARSLLVRNEVPPRELLVPRMRWLLILPAITAFNGATPYLGLKTEYSFAMYSNLRTEEGRTNHVVMPLLEVADYQRDVARVLESSDGPLALLARRRIAVPFQELHRRVQKRLADTSGDFSLTYLRQGQEFAVPSAAADPVLGAPLGFLERKLLCFREIPFERNACWH